MPFRFGLETVLKHRKRLEEAAQREYAEAQAAVNEVLTAIEVLYQRMDEVREEIAQAQAIGTPEKIALVLESEQFLVGLKTRIETLRLEARRLMAISEEKQEALIHAAREKKVLVKLKERRQQEHREWLRRIEAKELDDITMVRQVWGKR
jgi:flagellar FliJ protein